MLACQEEWGLPDGVQRNWVFPMPPNAATPRMSYTHYVGKCNHCQDAPCIAACPTGATFHDENGLVRVDNTACIRCGFCVDACPYNARLLHPDDGTVVKCDCCSARVAAGLNPVCVETCPAGARIFGDLDDPTSLPSRHLETHPAQRLETDQVRTDPQVYYTGSPETVARILAEYPPDPDRQAPPLQGRIIEAILRPVFLVTAALAIAGQGATYLAGRMRRTPAEPALDAGAEDSEDRMLRRHSPVGIGLHWFNALVWILQLITGLSLLSSDRYRVTPTVFNDWILSMFGDRVALLRTHVGLGLLWLTVFLLFSVLGARRISIPFLRHLLPDRTDPAWLRVRLVNTLRPSRKEAVPPQGKYNAGQKLFGLAILAGSAIIAATGLAMTLAPPGSPWIRWSIPIHFAAAAGVVLGLLVHIYMAAICPTERPAFFSMLHGRVPESHARTHNQRWWKKMTRSEP